MMNPICFSQIIGNEEVKKQLDCMVSKRAIGHALLFTGPDGIGKSLFAWALASRMMVEYDRGIDASHKMQAGHHPDVHVYHPEGKLGLHSIQSLRQLSEEVYLPPYEASWKVFIIHDAHRMLNYSANALLKTFEEPPPRTLIILLSHAKAALLPTILSRCCTLHFRAIDVDLIQKYLKENYKLDDATCFKIARQAQGSLGRARRLAEQGDAVRNDLLNVLAQGKLGTYRDLQECVQRLSEQADAIKKHAEDKAKEELSQVYVDQMPSHQQQALEKELEGLAALVLAQEAQSLFETILSWYRDIHLFLQAGDPIHLMNPDYQEAIEQTIQRGDFKPLPQVYQAVEEAYVALQRSTSLSLCLENLFLKLDRVR